VYLLRDHEPYAAAVDALPPELLAPLAELRASLELSPWTVGTPYVPTNPSGIRTATVAAGRLVLYYGVIERDRAVDLLNLVAV
jgi:hypothetical protein